MNNTLQTWSPINDLWNLQDVLDRFFFGRRKGKRREGESTAIWAPTVDVCEDKEAIKIYAELPGLEKKDVKIHVEEGVMTLKGERKFEDENKKGDYYRVERSYGSFLRSFTLPSTVDSENIKASMKNGV